MKTPLTTLPSINPVILYHQRRHPGSSRLLFLKSTLDHPKYFSLQGNGPEQRWVYGLPCDTGKVFLSKRELMLTLLYQFIISKMSFKMSTRSFKSLFSWLPYATCCLVSVGVAALLCSA